MDNEEQLKEVEELIKNHPEGLSSELIWEYLVSFESKVELSKVLFRLNQQCVIYKRNGLFFHPDAPSVDDKIKEYLSPEETKTPIYQEPIKPKPKVVKIKRTVVKPISTPSKVKEIATKRTIGKELRKPQIIESNGKPYGELRRTIGSGGAALGLYLLRKYDSLTLDDIGILTNSIRNCLYIRLSFLVDKGYVIKDSTNFLNPTFKWSDKFSYPFKDKRDSDIKLLATNIDDFLLKKIKQV